MYYYSCKDGDETITIASEIELIDPCNGIEGGEDSGSGKEQGSIGINPWGIFKIPGTPWFNPPEWAKDLMKTLMLLIIIVVAVFIIMKLKK